MSSFKPGDQLCAKYDYTAGSASEHSFRKGDVIVFKDLTPNGWGKGIFNNRVAWFPLKYVELLSQSSIAAPPLPPPRTPPMHGSPIRRRSHTSSSMSDFHSHSLPTVVRPPSPGFRGRVRGRGRGLRGRGRTKMQPRQGSHLASRTTQESLSLPAQVESLNLSPRYRERTNSMNAALSTPRNSLCKIHSVSVAEFDIDIGNTLTFTYPQNITFEGKKDKIANLCLPDGAHYHEDDWLYLLLWDKDVEDWDSDGPLFGMVYIGMLRDQKFKRGAVQKALLILASHPYFHLFKELLLVSIVPFLSTGDTSILTSLYTNLNSFFEQRTHSEQNIFCWQAPSIHIKLPFTAPDMKFDTAFPGASLLELIKQFGKKVMILWYTLLLRKRLLFSSSGQATIPAHMCANACIAAPLLILPFDGFLPHIIPYLSITDLTPMESNSQFYIAGVTNPLFDEHKDWYDTLAVFGKKKTTTSLDIKISPQDATFIGKVIDGVKKNEGEKWVRLQFKQYTKQLIDAVRTKRLSKDIVKVLGQFEQSPHYIGYSEKKQARILDKMNTFLAKTPTKRVDLTAGGNFSPLPSSPSTPLGGTQPLARKKLF